MDKERYRDAGAAMLVVAVLYVICGRLGLLLAVPPGYASALWLPAGLALTSVLFYGYRLWPGILLGSLLVNLGVDYDFSSLQSAARSALLPLAIGVGASLQAVLGAYLVRRFTDWQLALEQERQLLLMLALAGPLACVLNATWSVSILQMAGALTPGRYAFNWWNWWLGDSLGVLTVLPLWLLWRRPEVNWERRLVVTLPWLGLLALVLVFFQLARTWEYQRLEQEFGERVLINTAQLKQNIGLYLESLDSLHDFHQASTDVTREDFRRFSAGLLARHPGIVALSYDRLLNAGETAGFEAGRRAEGFADFQITEGEAGTALRAAASREQYVVVDYIEPFAANRRAFGYDVFSDPTRRRALASALRDGRLHLTEPLRLIQAPERGPALLAFLPVPAPLPAPAGAAEPAVAGFMTGVFIVGELIEPILASVNPDEIAVTLTDITAAAAPVLLYENQRSQNQGRGGPVPEPALLAKELVLNVADRHWQLRFGARQPYLLGRYGWHVYGVLVGGLLACAVQGLLLWLLTGRWQRERKLDLALRAQHEALQTSQLRFEQMAAHIPEAFFLADAVHKQLLYISPAFAAISGRSGIEVLAEPALVLTIVHADDRAALLALDFARPVETEFRIGRADGALRWLRLQCAPVSASASLPGHVAGLLEDITERKQAQLALQRLSRMHALLSETNAAMLRLHERAALLRECCRIAVECGGFKLAWAGLFEANRDLRIYAVHGGAGQGELSLNAGPEQVPWPTSECPVWTGLRCGELAFCQPTTACTPPATGMPELAPGALAILLPLPDGANVESGAESVQGVLVLYSDEAAPPDAETRKLLLELAADIGYALKHIERQHKLDYLAWYDELTGLPNLRLFLDRLQQFLQLAAQGERKVVLLLFNIDHFNQINEAHGRRVGDQLLRQVAERMLQALHAPFALSRVVADSFALAIADLPENADASTLLRDRVFAPLSGPFAIDALSLRLTIHVGIALAPADGRDAETLFHHGELALKQAKLNNERYLYYAPAFNQRNAEKRQMEARLLEALDKREFELYLQPKLDLRSRRLAGAEALIRWRHPGLGLVPPNQFIPLAEETGLIVPIGEWVLDTACALQAGWRARPLTQVPVAINLSAVQVRRGGLAALVQQALHRHQVPAHCLELELTESAVMQDLEQAARELQALRVLGCKLALDDFGTGYSSLAYLKRFPFDVVKIDRSFIIDLVSNPDDAAIAAAVIAMAHQLRLRVVAEGVETLGQLNFLSAHDCDEVQGYLLSPPVPVPAFETLLQNQMQLPQLPHSESAASRLLVVDDDAAVRAALTRLFRREGFEVYTAASAEDAMALQAEHRFRVIISDQRMPGMSGVEMFRRLKLMYPDSMRILLSGYADLDQVVDAINHGAVYKLLTKPWDDALLVEQIRDAFARYRTM